MHRQVQLFFKYIFKGYGRYKLITCIFDFFMFVCLYVCLHVCVNLSDIYFLLKYV